MSVGSLVLLARRRIQRFRLHTNHRPPLVASPDALDSICDGLDAVRIRLRSLPPDSLEPRVRDLVEMIWRDLPALRVRSERASAWRAAASLAELVAALRQDAGDVTSLARELIATRDPSPRAPAFCSLFERSLDSLYQQIRLHRLVDATGLQTSIEETAETVRALRSVVAG